GDARSAVAELGEAAVEAGLTRLAALTSSGDADAAFLGAVLDLSEFMRDSARRNPDALERLFGSSVAARLAAIEAEIAALAFADDASESGMMKDLRLLKSEAHFLIALADLAGEAEASDTVARLSRLADACVGAAVAFL